MGMPGSPGGAFGFVPLVLVALVSDGGGGGGGGGGTGPGPLIPDVLRTGSDAAAACGITSQSTSPVRGSRYSPLTPRIMRGIRASFSCCGEVGYVWFFVLNSAIAFAYCCIT